MAMEIGVFGLGRFGQFWAKYLRPLGTILGYNRSEREIDAQITRVDLKTLGQCDTVFICSAISSISAAAKSLRPHLKTNTLIIDTCSVKIEPLRVLSEELPDHAILGTHPMFGPDSAKESKGALPLVLSQARSSEDQYQLWKKNFADIGLKVIEMSADEHDRIAASTQGVTHFIGRLLSQLNLEPSEIATLGFKKIFEVMEQTCQDPLQLFIDLNRYNPYSSGVHKKLEAAFEQTISLVKENESDQRPELSQEN